MISEEFSSEQIRHLSHKMRMKELEPWAYRDSVCSLEVLTVLGTLVVRVVPETRQIISTKWKPDQNVAAFSPVIYFDEKGVPKTDNLR